jgi:hypothetical protein
MNYKILLCLLVLPTLVLISQNLFQPVKKFSNGPESITATSSLIFTASPDKKEVKFAETPKVVVVRTNEILKAIEYCESRGNPKAKNPTSSASGALQFTKGSWEYYGKKYWGSLEGKNVFNGNDNRELGMYVLKTVGTAPWKSSSACWQPRLARLS